ncbi:MAG: PilZ domain-containing protein [Acidimicrobiia bacterium]
MSIEKRNNPRLTILGELRGRTVTLDEPVTVNDMSEGGLTIETGFRLPIGSLHDFRLAFDHWSAILSGRVLHSRTVVQGDRVTYVSGIQFVETSPESQTVISEWLDSIRTGRPEESSASSDK